jgi:hypothetical protein
LAAGASIGEIQRARFAAPEGLGDGLRGDQQMERKIDGHGWKPAIPDGRDLLSAAPVEALPYPYLPQPTLSRDFWTIRSVA